MALRVDIAVAVLFVVLRAGTPARFPVSMLRTYARAGGKFKFVTISFYVFILIYFWNSYSINCYY